MDRRTLVALTAAITLARPAAAAAQAPKAAARDTIASDTLAPQLLDEEMLAPNSAIVPRIVLHKGTVYRIETQPAQQVAVRYSRLPSQPPLFMLPLGGGGPNPSGSGSVLVVPRSTEEYRIDVSYTTDQPVRLEVWTDPEEMSRWARMREKTRGLPAAGLDLRAVYLGPFIGPQVSPYSTTTSRGMASAAGVEACLAVAPRGAWVSGRVGGCVLAVSRLSRPGSAGGLWFLTTQPRYELSSPGAAIEQSVVLTAGIGTTVSLPIGSGSTDYVELGLGYLAATPLLGRHLWAEAQAGVSRMQELGGGFDPMGRASLVPDLALGVQFRF